MRGSFFGMNVSMSGIFTAQRNLDTIAHNNANVETNGYTRQKVTQSALSPIRLYNHTGMVGTGSGVVSVARMRDIYLDQKIRFQSTGYGEWTQKSSLVDQVQLHVSGGSDGRGYNDVMNGMYNALEEFSKDPTNMSLRSVVKEQATTYTTYFNNLAQSLEKLQEDTNFDVKAKVELVNSIGHRIETLNKQIYQVEILGEAANDLRDARDLLVDELAGIVNIDYGEHNYGKLPSGADDMRFYIYIGGTQFLQHFNEKKSTVNELTCVARTEKINEEDAYGLYDVMWTKPVGREGPVEITGGELRGLLDVRDGNSGYVQTDRFDMTSVLPTKLDIELAFSDGAAPPVFTGTVELNLTFDEYVPNVENMSAAELAQYISEKLNSAIAEQTDIDVTPEHRAVVEITDAGKLSVDLTSLNNAAPPVVASIDKFVLTAPADLKQALGFTGTDVDVADGTGESVFESDKNIENAVETCGYKGIPYYLRKLNEYVRTYALAFNEGFVDGNTDYEISADEVLTGHASGYNITQEEGEPPSGVRFFTMMDSRGAELGTGDFLTTSEQRMPSLYGLDPDSQEYKDNIIAITNAYRKVTAKNFSVSRDVLNDPALISNSARAGDVEDNANILDVIGQRKNAHMFSEGAAEDFMQSLTTDAAVDTNQADYMVTTQQKYIAMLEEHRTSISGVWQDEEFADMVRQQQAYSASAMMFNTFNAIYDTLINRLGLA